MHKQYGITVKDILSIDVVNRLQVVAGHNGLGRFIKLVNIIEMPDIMEWIVEGEFLFTTGYSFREYPELMNQLIPKMAETGCAALAVKPKRFLKDIPDKLIANADKYNIPLLEVPYDLSFSEITAPILELISNRQNKILQKIHRAHKTLIDMALKGSNLVDLSFETSRLINNPVTIIDQNGVFYLPADDPNLPRFKDLYSEGNVETTSEKLLFDNISEIRYSLQSSADRGKTSAVQAVCIPIAADQSEYGHICAIADKPIIEADILILERASTIAALEFTKRKAVYEIEKGYYSEFLEILLSREFTSEDEIIKRGRVFNIDLRRPTAVLLINDSDNSLEEMHLPARRISAQSTREILLKAMNSYQASVKGYQFITGIKGSNVVSVVEVPAENPNIFLKDAITGLAEHLDDSCHFQDNHEIKMGVGRPYQGVKHISQSYWEAREALKVSLISKRSRINFFDDLGYLKILSENKRADLEKYVRELLDPVFEYDQKKNGELVKTLDIYFNSNRNLKLTAHKNFIHYNTALYRIRKIEELTGRNLNNPEDLLSMEIAINIIKLLQLGR